ncbi:MAG: hypothetical protein BroJett040_05480 [Oligoflexia bacterium]|nr:MAG: hypothetical protein BroJett040_05480 [Oligoflexia bacterium]
MKQICLYITFVIQVGCATGKEVIKSDSIQPLNSLKYLISNVQVRGALLVGKFRDDRPTDERNWVAYTGMFNQETPLELDVSVSDFVQKRIQAGLQRRGIDVLGSSRFILMGSIKKLKVWENTNGWTPESSGCVLELDFFIFNSDRRLIYKGMASAMATGVNNILDTTDSNGPVLETCMQIAVDKIVDDSQFKAVLEFRSASSSHTL